MMLANATHQLCDLVSVVCVLVCSADASMVGSQANDSKGTARAQIGFVGALETRRCRAHLAPQELESDPCEAMDEVVCGGCFLTALANEALSWTFARLLCVAFAAR